MSNESEISDLFDRWERVWHEGQYDLVPSCVGPHYIRHDENGDRTVTREAYAAELASIHRERPGIRVVVYDHSFTADRAWFRFSFRWTAPRTGEPRNGPTPLRKSAGLARRRSDRPHARTNRLAPMRSSTANPLGYRRRRRSICYSGFAVWMIGDLLATANTPDDAFATAVSVR